MSEFRFKDRVRHWKFGEGTVALPEDAGRVVVNFHQSGRKVLDAATAKLTLVERHPFTVEDRAARMASHLRRLAAMLRERGAAAPPLPAQMHLGILRSIIFPEFFRRRLFIEWLRLILRQRTEPTADAAGDTVRDALNALEREERDRPEYSTAASNNAPRLRLHCRRISRHASRWNTADVDSIVAWYAWNYNWSSALYDAALYWTALTPDLRFMLTTDRVPRIEALAAMLEGAAGLRPCPPRWGPRSGGQWRNVAYSLVMKLDVSADYLTERARAAGASVTIDFLALRLEPAALAEPRSLNLVQQCRTMLMRTCTRLREGLRVARVEFTPRPDVPPCYAVYIETWERGMCVEGTLERRGALKYAWLNGGGYE